MDSRRVVLLLLFIFLVTASCTYYLYQDYQLLERHEVPIDFTVEESIGGINTETDALHFGTVPLGGVGKRSMTVTPVHDSVLIIDFKGDAARFMSTNASRIEVLADRPVRISFSATVPEDAPTGSYTGTAVFSFYRS